jgi:hypothetical protein
LYGTHGIIVSDNKMDEVVHGPAHVRELKGLKEIMQRNYNMVP